MQTYYLSSSSIDGKDDECDKLGFKRLQEYNPSQRTWKYLCDLAEANNLEEQDFPFEELGDEDYLASLPFAALFSCFKVSSLFLKIFISFFVCIQSIFVERKTLSIHCLSFK